MNSHKGQKKIIAVELQEFTGLVKLHQSSLRAFIRSIGVCREMVDDYAQEAFLVAYKKFDEYDSERASFGIWVKGISRFLILNDKRKSARRLRLQNQFICDLLISDPISMDENNENELEALQGCISKLEDPSKTMLRKRYEEKKNSKELALIFNRKPSAIRQQLLRIRLILKNCLDRTLEA
jgi:RNA polymerase sigma-70 factor (ECF subfamily)